MNKSEMIRSGQIQGQGQPGAQQRILLQQRFAGEEQPGNGLQRRAEQIRRRGGGANGNPPVRHFNGQHFLANGDHPLARGRL